MLFGQCFNVQFSVKHESLMCVKCREADQEHPASAEELYGCDSEKHSDEALLDHVIYFTTVCHQAEGRSFEL